MNEVAHGQLVGIRRVGRPDAVDESARDCKQSSPQRSSDDELVLDAELAGDRGPADHVVREDCALQPCRVRVEVAGRDVLEAGAFFEIADREFDHGVLTVELVELDSGGVEVGEEPEVSPVGPRFQLLLVGEAVRRTIRRRVTFFLPVPVV